MALNASVLEDVDEPEGIVRVANSATTLVTHLRPDLDALLAVWMFQRLRHHAGMSQAKVLFIPANAKGVRNGTLAVDMGNGKGVRPFGNGHCLKWSAHPEGGSASMAVWRALPLEDRNIFEHLVKAISDADHKGENVHRTIVNKSASAVLSESVKNQVQSTNLWTVHQSVMNIATDEELWRMFSSFFDGYLMTGMMEREASSLAGQAEILCDGVLAVLPHNSPPPTSRLVFERGPKLAVFSSEIGSGRWTLGVSRSVKHSASYINLAQFQDDITEMVPGIYIHPGGFFAGWTAAAPLICKMEDFEKKKEDLIRAMVMVVTSSAPVRE